MSWPERKLNTQSPSNPAKFEPVTLRQQTQQPRSVVSDVMGPPSTRMVGTTKNQGTLSVRVTTGAPIPRSTKTMR